MKKSLKILIIIILLILLTGGIWLIFNKDYNEEHIVEGVSMEIKNGTLTNSGAVIILRNDSDIDVFYGNPYSIQVKKDGKWQDIESDLAFTLPAFSLKSKSSEEIRINWEYGYGKLEKGEYRITKGFHYEKEKEVYVGFSVNVEFVLE